MGNKSKLKKLGSALKEMLSGYRDEQKNNNMSPEEASQMILKKLTKKGYIKWIK